MAIHQSHLTVIVEASRERSDERDSEQGDQQVLDVATQGAETGRTETWGMSGDAGDDGPAIENEESVDDATASEALRDALDALGEGETVD